MIKAPIRNGKCKNAPAVKKDFPFSIRMLKSQKKGDHAKMLLSTPPNFFACLPARQGSSVFQFFSFSVFRFFTPSAAA